ncbi:hypothetical protein BLNAU_3772 [Blattamonas nauphoetae]|uniref:Uncharacterized protein n=1 Tax=Blattamonas nauphoetae TaxID=2049346 RepID=A0ABQ9YCD5_9EUKA|nr:hypothetical protein BLNAU_3772 [Blattamonas nauphoetae]
MKKERAAILKPNPPTPSPSPQSHQVEAEIQTPKPSPSPKPGPPLHEPVPLNLPERRRPRAHHPGSDTPPTPLLSPTVDRSPLFSPTPTRNQSDYSDPKNRSRSSSPTLSHSSDALNSATPARTVQKSKRRTATGSTADRGKARMKPGIKKRSNHGFTRKNGDDITAIRDLLRNKDDDEPGQPILRRSTRLQAREISTLLGTKEDDGIEEQMANDEEAASPRANIKREAMQQALDQFGRLREEEWMTRLKEKTKLAEIGVMGLETLYDDVIHRAPPNSLEADLVAHRERERVRIAQLRTERAKKEQERKEKIVEARRNAVPMPELYDLLVMKEDHDQLT